MAPGSDPQPLDGVGSEDQFFLTVQEDSYGLRRKSGEPGGQAGTFIQQSNCRLEADFVITDPDISMQRLGFKLIMRARTNYPRQVCVIYWSTVQPRILCHVIKSEFREKFDFWLLLNNCMTLWCEKFYEAICFYSVKGSNLPITSVLMFCHITLANKLAQVICF